MKARTTVLSAVALVGGLLAGAFAYSEHRVTEDRSAAAAVCAAVPLGVSVPAAIDSIRTRSQVRFDGDLGASAIVALKGPAYCYCKFSLRGDGMIESSKALCHH